MSRIGKLPISIPAGVTVTQGQDGVVTVKGPKGELSQKVDASIKMNIADGHITFEIDENSPVKGFPRSVSCTCQQYGCWCKRRL